jgi:hypothetical protein
MGQFTLIGLLLMASAAPCDANDRGVDYVTMAFHDGQFRPHVYDEVDAALCNLGPGLQRSECGARLRSGPHIAGDAGPTRG